MERIQNIIPTVHGSIQSRMQMRPVIKRVKPVTALSILVFGLTQKIELFRIWLILHELFLQGIPS